MPNLPQAREKDVSLYDLADYVAGDDEERAREAVSKVVGDQNERLKIFMAAFAQVSVRRIAKHIEMLGRIEDGILDNPEILDSMLKPERVHVLLRSLQTLQRALSGSLETIHLALKSPDSSSRHLHLHLDEAQNVTAVQRELIRKLIEEMMTGLPEDQRSEITVDALPALAGENEETTGQGDI